MARALQLYLIVTGIGTAICLFAPGLVVIGLFLIVPGLILMVMPTLFLWGCVFAGFRLLLRAFAGHVAATTVAMVATAAVLSLLPLPGAAASRLRLAQAVRADVSPAARLTIRGHVRIDMPFVASDTVAGSHLLRCSALCAATLFTRGVESVTVNSSGGEGGERDAIGVGPLAPSARTFHLAPRAACAATIVPDDASGLGNDYAGVRALQAEWNLRLSTRDCIVAVPTRQAHDFVIAQGRYRLFETTAQDPWSLAPRPVDVERVEVRRGDGTVLLRRLIARTATPSVPLYVGATGGIENFRFGWNRASLSNAARYATVDVGEVLKAHTDLAMTGDPAATAALVRDRLQAMIADPAVRADDTGWTAAGSYFAALRKGSVSDADRRLLSALIRDRRMTRFRGIWDVIRALGTEGTILRAPMVDRLARPGPDDEGEAGRTLALAIDALPPGTFADPSTAELALLADPAARVRARGLVSRQADRGAAAVPLLLDILDHHAAAHALRDPQARRSGDDRDRLMIDAVGVAFCRIGPAGASALPRLMALYDGSLSREIGGDRDWTLTLARLGQPVDSFAKPADLSNTVEQYHANLRDRMAHFQADRDCRSNYV